MNEQASPVADGPRRFLASRRASLVGLVLVGVALMFLPYVLGLGGGQGWVRLVNFSLLYVMLALGLNIVVGFAGLLDLGYIAFYAVGAYTWALLASPHFDLHLPFWVILPVGVAVACLFGLLLGAPTLKLRGDYLAIVTLGFGEIIRIFMTNLNAPVNITNGPQGINRIDPLTVGSFSFAKTESFHVDFFGLLAEPVSWRLTGPDKYYYLLVVLAIVIMALCIRLQTSRVGRAWEAVREDEVAANAMGINTRNIKLMAFAMGASFGGLAGGLFASMQRYISPESFSLLESVSVLCMVVLGGMGHVPGVVFGAILLAVFPEVLRHVVVPLQEAVFGAVVLDPEAIRMMLFGIAMVAVMLWRPEGLWPSPVRKRELAALEEDGGSKA